MKSFSKQAYKAEVWVATISKVVSKTAEVIHLIRLKSIEGTEFIYG
jgi:hypothetical protein